MNFDDFLTLAQSEGSKVFLYNQTKKQGFVMMPAEEYAANIGAEVDVDDEGDDWDDVWGMPAFSPDQEDMVDYDLPDDFPLEEAMDSDVSEFARDLQEDNWEDKLREATEQGDERAARILEGVAAARTEVEASPDGPDSHYEPVASEEEKPASSVTWQPEQPLDPEGSDPVFYDEPV